MPLGKYHGHDLGNNIGMNQAITLFYISNNISFFYALFLLKHMNEYLCIIDTTGTTFNLYFITGLVQ